MRRRGLVVLCCSLLAGCGDEPVQVSAGGFGAFEPALAVIDGRLAVAWNDNRHGNDEIYLRLLGDDLSPLTSELRLTNNPELSYEAALATFAGKLALAWYDRDAAGHFAVKLGLWDTDGRALWSKAISPDGVNGRIPVLQPADGGLFVAWVEDAPDAATPSTLWGAELDARGNWIRAPFAIAPASRTTWNLNADVLADGRVAIVFDRKTETRASELYLALVGADGSSVARLSADDGQDSKYPDLALRGERGALTWFDVKDGNEEVYLAPIDPAALPRDLGTSARRITQTNGDSVGAYLAWNGATLGLAWNDNDAGQHEIFFQTFDAALEPLGEARRLTHTDAQSLIPAIVAHRDGFALAWNEAVYGEGGHDGERGTTRSEIAVTAVK